MKTLTTICMLMMLSLNSHARAEIGREGGGGDPSEDRYHEIREDIKAWIENEGSADLVLPKDIGLSEYNYKMLQLLEPHAVVVSFTTDKVLVDGKEKTCRSWWPSEGPQTQCNIDRFDKTSEEKQYRLVHHEFAGLALIERNLGASSDYQVSQQLGNYLEKVQITEDITALRLAVKSFADNKAPKVFTIYDDHFYREGWGELVKPKNLSNKKFGQMICDGLGAGKLIEGPTYNSEKRNCYAADKVICYSYNKEGQLVARNVESKIRSIGILNVLVKVHDHMSGYRGLSRSGPSWMAGGVKRVKRVVCQP